jgi:class 3 adenylate cyclase
MLHGRSGMSWRPVFCGIIVLAQALLGGCAPTSARAPDAARPASASFRQVPLGLCEDYPEETRSLAEVGHDLTVLDAAGIDVLRISIGWDGVEPQRDRYDFAFWDAFVEQATGAGVTLIPYVAYTPEWNADGTPESFWKTPPRDPNEFGELMRLLAERYRGRVHSWELWNEADNRDYWLGSAEQFATLIAAGAAGVHAGDPTARVVLGGLAGGVDFLRELFDEPSVAELIDVVNLHGYYETWNPNPIETFPEYVREVKEIVERHGGRQSLWMAEVGYSNFAPPPQASVAARYPYEHTLEFQAVALVRTLALLLAEPAVSLIAWYELKDARPVDAVIGDAHNRHLGVTFADYRPKPALAALAFMSGLFKAGFRSLDRELHVEAEPGSRQVSRAFITAQREVVIIAWLPTEPGSPRSTASPESERRIGKLPPEIVRVSFPRQALGSAIVHDATGKVLGERRVHEQGGVSELELELRGAEVQVLRIPLGAER